MLKRIINFCLFFILSFSLLFSLSQESFSCNKYTENELLAVKNERVFELNHNLQKDFFLGEVAVAAYAPYFLSPKESSVGVFNTLLKKQKPKIFDAVKDFFVKLFGINKSSVVSNTDDGESRFVYLGGNAIGFSIEGEGVVVVGISEVETEHGRDVPTKFSNLKEGDIIKKIEGVEINSGEKIGEVINAEQYIGKTLNIEVDRDGKILNTTIKPALDSLTKKYKLGLWIRDNSSGVGTLTFVEKNGDFAALGHPVSDIDTGTIMPIKNGYIYKSIIIGVNKGVRGVPGELKGMFVKGANSVGKITVNNNSGIHGKIEQDSVQYYSNREIEVAKRSEITPGKASVFACIDGSKVEEFEIEIIKTNNQTTSTEKNMVIRVCDKKLLEYTGGIVQGMSGSPIVQRGKLVGCVTHVFINDPSKGFGIFIDTMHP